MKQDFVVHSKNNSLLKAFFNTLLEMGAKNDAVWNAKHMDEELVTYLSVPLSKEVPVSFHTHDCGDHVFNLPSDWDKAIAQYTENRKEEASHTPEMKGMVKVTAEQLKQRLSNPVPVRFTFTKKDGQIRHAIGTRYVDNIPCSAAPTGSRKESATAVSYYDYTVQAWRSLTKDTEIFLDTNF